MKRRGMFGEARDFLSGNDTYKKSKGSNERQSAKDYEQAKKSLRRAK